MLNAASQPLYYATSAICIAICISYNIYVYCIHVCVYVVAFLIFFKLPEGSMPSKAQGQPITVRPAFSAFILAASSASVFVLLY